MGKNSHDCAPLLAAKKKNYLDLDMFFPYIVFNLIKE